MSESKSESLGAVLVAGLLLILGLCALEASASNRALISVRYERYGPGDLFHVLESYEERISRLTNGPCSLEDPRAWYLGAGTHGPIFVDRCAFALLSDPDPGTSNPFSTVRTSIFNGLGIFYQDNPYAPPLLDPTRTIWAVDASGLSVPAYDASRPGYIRIKRGARGFGGTMRWFSGANHFRNGINPSSASYPSLYYRWNAMRTRTNNGHRLTRNERGNQFTDPQRLGQRLTYNSSHYATAPGGAIVRNHWGYQTLAPFTTGTVTLDPDVKCPSDLEGTCHWVYSGYDNRYRTSDGALGGHLSLVQPFLSHSYPENFDPDVEVAEHYGFVDRVTFAFGQDAVAKGMTPVPEPEWILLLGMGLIGLTSLYALGRR